MKKNDTLDYNRKFQTRLNYHNLKNRNFTNGKKNVTYSSIFFFKYLQSENCI